MPRLGPSRGLRKLEEGQRARTAIRRALSKAHGFGCDCADCVQQRTTDAAAALRARKEATK